MREEEVNEAEDRVVGVAVRVRPEVRVSTGVDEFV